MRRLLNVEFETRRQWKRRHRYQIRLKRRRRMIGLVLLGVLVLGLYIEIPKLLFL